MCWRVQARPRVPRAFAARAALALGVLALAAAPAVAQPWLGAATEAARAELADLYGYGGPVALTAPAEHPLDPPVAGDSGFYTAAMDGTPWLAWGVLDTAGAVVVSGLSRPADPADAVPLFAGELARFRLGTSNFPFLALSNYVALQQLHGVLSVEIRASALRAILDLHRQDPARFPGVFSEMARPFSP